MEIIGHVMKYQWGKLGHNSIVAQIASLNSETFEINEETTYSELWMGDHPSGPSILKDTSKNLGEMLQDNRNLIGGQKKLPFLFKVLSIQKALSIQSHPNKLQAELLNCKWPDLYPDDNHKPEIAIALTPFQGLCGFRPNAETHKILLSLPPIVELLGGEKVVGKVLDGPEGLKKCFTIVMHADNEAITKCSEALSKNHSKILSKYGLLEVFNKLKQEYPGDVGIIAMFFLNFIRLKPGEAIFLAPNVIHSYISGDCVECMACSDNVIRAGLTPKYKDVETLLSYLEFEAIDSEDVIFRPTTVDEFLQRYIPPVKDFAVTKIELPWAKHEYQVKVGYYGGILIVIEGERLLSCPDNREITISRGSIVFIPAFKEMISLKFLSSMTHDLGNFLGYVATYNWFIN